MRRSLRGDVDGMGRKSLELKYQINQTTKFVAKPLPGRYHRLVVRHDIKQNKIAAAAAEAYPSQSGMVGTDRIRERET